MQGNLQGIYKSTDGGQTWAKTGGLPASNYQGTQGQFDSFVLVKVLCGEYDGPVRGVEGCDERKACVDEGRVHRR